MARALAWVALETMLPTSRTLGESPTDVASISDNALLGAPPSIA
jgi:hypothetical protein